MRRFARLSLQPGPMNHYCELAQEVGLRVGFAVQPEIVRVTTEHLPARFRRIRQTATAPIIRTGRNRFGEIALFN